MTLGMAGLTLRMVSLALGMEVVTLRMEIATLEVDDLIIGMKDLVLGMVGLATGMAGVALGMGDLALGIAGLMLGTATLGFSTLAKEQRPQQAREHPCDPSAAAYPCTAPGTRHFPWDRTQPQVTSCSSATLHRFSFGVQTLRELRLQLRLPPAAAAPKKTDPCV